MVERDGEVPDQTGTNGETSDSDRGQDPSTESDQAAARDGKLKELARRLQLARAEDNPSERFPRGRATFLIGAGCSVTAGIQPAKGVVDIALSWLAQKLLREKKKCSLENFAALKKHGVAFKSEYGSQLYGEIFEEHITDPDHEKSILRNIISDQLNINWAHICLGHFVEKKIVHTVMTTNFDLLALKGIMRCNVIPVVADGLENLSRIDGAPIEPQVIHIHGSMHTYRIRNSRRAVSEPAQATPAQVMMSNLVRYSTVFVVVGYRGGEEGVMELLEKALIDNDGKDVFWIAHGQDLSPRVRDLAKKLGNRFVPIFDQDADDFFDKMVRATGIGAPAWLTDPVAHLRSIAKEIIPPN